jgi:hypothetical protein
MPQTGLMPVMRLIAQAFAPIWAQRPVDVRAPAPPDVLLAHLATMARKVPQNNTRLWFTQPPGQRDSFTARLAPAADRSAWSRFLHATVEPMNGGSRVFGWFQARRGLAIAVEVAILFSFIFAVATVIHLARGEVSAAGQDALVIFAAPAIVGGALGLVAAGLWWSARYEDRLLALIAAVPATDLRRRGRSPLPLSVAPDLLDDSNAPGLLGTDPRLQAVQAGGTGTET